MTKYVRTFIEDPINPSVLSMPAGVSNVYLESGLITCVMQQNSPTVPRYLGDRFVSCCGTVGAVNRRGACGIDSINADAARADAQVLTRHYNQTGGTNPVVSAIGVRCTGTPAAWTGYFAELRRTSAASVTVAIVKGIAGVDTDLATSVQAINAGTPIWVRFEVRGTNQKLKVWTGDYTDEPVGWTITAADAVINATGAVTFGGRKGAAGDAGGINTDFVCVGTGTDNAPAPPKTWADYLDFLRVRNALRCVLMEIDVLGRSESGAALPARVCMSNMAFTSKPEDQNPNLPYEAILIEAPKNRRKIAVPPKAKMSITTGDAIFKNAVIAENESGYLGRLDHWLTWNWDGRPYQVLIGHPSWRRCDFKRHFIGVSQDIYRSAYGRLGLRTNGADGVMQRPVPISTIGGSGPNASSLMPVCAGQFFNVDITSLLYDENTLTYQVAPPNSNIFAQNENHDLRDSGGSLKKAQRTISAVNTGTDTITFDAAHGLIVGSSVVFPAGFALPAPLVTATPYYAKTVPAVDQVTLSATPGGATIDITTATTGAPMIGRLYRWSDVTGRVTLLSNPAGQLTFDAFGSFAVPAQTLISYVAGYAGVFINPGFVIDTFHGSQLTQLCGIWFNQQRTLGDVVNEIATSVGASLCQTREGNFYYTVVGVPNGAPAWTIRGDVKNWRVGERFLPADVERLGYQKNYTIQKQGLLGSVTPGNRDLYGRPYTLANVVVSDSGLDVPANHLLRRTPPERVTLMSSAVEAANECKRLYDIYKKTCSTWVFDTGPWALAVEPGDLVNITTPRDGFQTGKTAMVVGISDDPIRGRVELEVFAQVDGAWPVVTASNPFVASEYY